MDCDVVVVGAGPVGLMVGCELRLAGLRVVVVERRTEIDHTIKALGLNLPTVEALYRRGLLPMLRQAQQRELTHLLTFLAEGRHPASAIAASTDIAGHFAGIVVSRENVDYDDPELGDRGFGRDPLPVSQQTLEQILATRAEQLGVAVRRGVEVEKFAEQDDGVDVQLSSGERIRCGWLVGADGGRSTIRQLAGFDFPGSDPGITGLQAMVELENPQVLRPGWNRSGTGLYVYTPFPGRVLSVEMTGPPTDRDAPVTRDELQASLRRVSQTDVTIVTVKTATRFTDHARQASTYCKGRIILAGDAAHVHSPFGGQGLNLGIGDAMNLGWKLAAQVNGWAPEGLLDTYTGERHPVGAAVLDWTRAQVALMRLDPLTESLRRIVGDLVNTRNGATYLVKRLSAVAQRYALPGEHPLTGYSAPDLRVDEHRRLGDLMHDGRAILVGPPALAGTAASRPDRLTHVESPDGTALLVRPDGFVAWACDDPYDVSGLDDAVRTWLGQ
jgi:2-polyprenyl-6-methoxyphenol hydroxylase-like FAD-dependent oxidoreductase